MKPPFDKPFDDADLMELLRLAAYLETRTDAGHFPKTRFNRYSDALDRLVRHLADAEDKA